IAPRGNTAFRLLPPSPNPARGPVSVPFELGRATWVTLDVIDIAGRPMRRLAAGEYAPGTHLVRWSATDASGQRVPPGFYFLRARIAGAVAHQIVIELR